MDRRTFIATGTLAAGVVLAPAQGAPGSGDAALDALFARIAQADIAESPENASSLGLDKGALAPLKRRLDAPGAAARAARLARNRRALADLAKVDPATLSDAGKLNLEVVR